VVIMHALIDVHMRVHARVSLPTEIRLTSMHTFYCTRLWVEVEASQEAGEQGVQELAARRNGGGNIHSRMRKMLGPGVCFCI